MRGNSTLRTWPGSVLWASGCGAVFAIVFLYASYLYAGGGEGTYLPAYILFGHTVSLWMATSINDLDSTTFLASFVIATICQYGLYGAVIALGRSKGVGLQTFVAVALLHHTGYAWAAFVLDITDGLYGFDYAVGSFGLLVFLAFSELFVAAHVFACQYACSHPPYRPRLSLAAMIVFFVAAAIAAMFYVQMVDNCRLLWW